MKTVWLLVFLLHSLRASAEHLLNFTAPDLTPVVKGAGLPHYTVGDNVTIRWTTPFKDTTLMVFQLKEHTFAYEVLAINYKSWENSFIWQVHPVKGTPLDGHPFHFVLENSNSFSCDGCVTRGPWFNAVEKSEAATKGSAAVTTSSSSKTHTTQDPTAVGAAGAAHTQETKSHGDSNKARDIGLGVGLGLGIPLLLALFLILFLCLRRRNRKPERFSYHPTNSGNWTTDQTAGDTQQMRESGALGPYATRSAGSQASLSHASHISNPFLSNASASRPSYAPSAMSRMSHKSWIDDFEFEKPEMRDQDAMSQLRHSIHSSDGSHRSGYGTPLNGRATPTKGKSPVSPVSGSNLRQSWVAEAPPLPGSSRRAEMSPANTDLSSLEGLPVQPQATHYRPGQGESTGDGRDWPLPWNSMSLRVRNE